MMTMDEAFYESLHKALKYAPDRAKVLEEFDKRLDLAIKQRPDLNAYVMEIRDSRTFRS